jgi:hypothetical protein
MVVDAMRLLVAFAEKDLHIATYKPFGNASNVIDVLFNANIFPELPITDMERFEVRR